MISWFKLRCSISTNAKIATAGGSRAFAVYAAVLIQHINHGHSGRVAVSKVAPDVLRIEAVALVGDMPQRTIAAVFDRCVEAGLLRVENSDVVVCGYDEQDMPACGKCRKPNDDHRFGTCAKCRDNRAKSPTDTECRDMSRHADVRLTDRLTEEKPRASARGGASPRSRTRPAAPVAHIQNMPLGAPSCLCSECVAFRAKASNGLRAVE